jgi:hypothetical protein
LPVKKSLAWLSPEASIAQMSSPGPSGGAVSGGAMLAQPETSVKTRPKTAPAAEKKKAGFFMLIVSAKNPANYILDLFAVTLGF